MYAGNARVVLVMSLFAACWSRASLAQEPDAPRLPKGGVAPPAKLLEGLPTDAAEVYRPVSGVEDAEAAYLVALSEFDPDMADCWPEEGRRERKQVLRDRLKRHNAVLAPADFQG